MEPKTEQEVTLPQVAARMGTLENKLDLILVKLDGVATIASVDNLAAMVAEQFHVYDGRFDRLEAGQAKLEAGQEKLGVDVENLQVGQQRLEVNVQNLQAGQKRIEVDIGNLQVGQQRLEGAVGRITMSLEDIKLKQVNSVPRFEMVHMGKRVDRVEKNLKLTPLEPLPV